MLQAPLNLETATTTVVPLFRSPNDFMKIAELTNKNDRAVLVLIGIFWTSWNDPGIGVYTILEF